MVIARVLRIAVVCVTCLSSVACFEEPVREHLHLHLASGAIVVVWTIDIEGPEAARGNSEVARRMDASREQLERGLTPASGWFARVTADADRTTIERVEGLIRRGRWTAVFTKPREIENLLAEIGLTALVNSDAIDGTAELYLEPSAAVRATRGQRQLADQQLAEWSTAVSEYISAGIQLYAYLERRPERAAACFENLFADDEHVSEVWPLSGEEERLVEAVSDGVDDVAAVLVPLDDQAYSPNELSRLVYDPFPARLTVSASGDVVTSEGLVEVAGGLERPPTSLWHALRGLEGMWLAPDIVTEMVAPGPKEAQPDPDPSAFAARTRSYGAAPTRFDIEDEIRSRLSVVVPISVRWQGPAPGAGEVTDPGSLVAFAEVAVPS